MASLYFVAPIVFGSIIGIYEMIILHRDVTVPTHRFMHSLTALVYAIIATFATMNSEWVCATFLQNIPFLKIPLVLQVGIGIITMIKIHGASAAIKSSSGTGSIGLKETWIHSFFIAALVVAAPYIFTGVRGALPTWMLK